MTNSQGQPLFNVGTGKAVITPPLGTLLSGFGHRDHGAEGVLDDLELRTFWFEESSGSHRNTPDIAASDGSSGPVCIISADLIGFDAPLTAQLREDLSQAYGVAPEAVLLAASHTHSGPQTSATLAAAGGLPVPEYIATLRERVVAAVGEARQRARPATLHGGRGVLEDGFAINRRRKENGRVLNAPNPPGVKDDEVIALTAKDVESGEVVAVLYHFTCHPTTMGDYRITGDYPGAARRLVEAALPGASAGFLPGCFGDIRPNCTILGAKRFRRGTPEDVAAFGAALGTEVVRIATKGSDASFAPHVRTWADEIELPLEAAGESRNLSIQRLDLAENLTLIAMGGEVCVDFGHVIKGLNPDAYLIPVGYANGLIGYISSARLFPEGGYEPDSSYKVYGLPSPFHPSIDGILRDEIERIAEL